MSKGDDWREIQAQEHKEKYEALAQKIGIDKLIPLIPASKERVAECLKCDEELNLIPLTAWDKAAGQVGGRNEKCTCCGHPVWQKEHLAMEGPWLGHNTPFIHTLCTRVCVLKHVARFHYL